VSSRASGHAAGRLGRKARLFRAGFVGRAVLFGSDFNPPSRYRRLGSARKLLLDMRRPKDDAPANFALNRQQMRERLSANTGLHRECLRRPSAARFLISMSFAHEL
jgi:hypothetical protein